MKTACGIWLALMAMAHAAALDFKETVKEVHAPADVKTVAAEFEFTNRTDKTVNVTKYDSTCSCMSVMIKDGKLRYAPGESGVVRTEFDMGNFSGAVDKVVAIWLDNDPADKPSLSLTVRVHIPVLIALEPKTVKWDVGGKPDPQTIHITMRHTKPVRVTSAESSNQDFKLEVKILEEGKSYDLIVTPTNIGTPGLGVFRIITDCDIEKHKTQQAFAVVRKMSPAAAPAKP